MWRKCGKKTMGHWLGKGGSYRVNIRKSVGGGILTRGNDLKVLIPGLNVPNKKERRSIKKRGLSPEGGSEPRGKSPRETEKPHKSPMKGREE